MIAGNDYSGKLESNTGLFRKSHESLGVLKLLNRTKNRNGSVAVGSHGLSYLRVKLFFLLLTTF